MTVSAKLRRQLLEETRRLAISVSTLIRESLRRFGAAEWKSLRRDWKKRATYSTRYTWMKS